MTKTLRRDLFPGTVFQYAFEGANTYKFAAGNVKATGAPFVEAQEFNPQYHQPVRILWDAALVAVKICDVAKDAVEIAPFTDKHYAEKAIVKIREGARTWASFSFCNGPTIVQDYGVGCWVVTRKAWVPQFDGLTAAQCLEKYQRNMRGADLQAAAFLTVAQKRAAQEAWAAALAVKRTEAETKERNRVLVDLEYEVYE